MKTFEISVKDKIAVLTNREMYVCGNSDYVVNFHFDAEWDAYDTKTARFAYKGTYQDQVFQGTQCPVPIIQDTQIIMVGVFAGNLHTTTAACIGAKRSILSGSGVPADPAPDVYAQIMELIQGLGDPDPETIAAAVAEYIRNNPIEEIDPTVPAWAKAAEKPAYTAAEVGAISQEDLQAATDAALSQAKESGLFDGQKGDPGKDGKSAYQYAVEGGYTGTESEFAAKMAAEYLPLRGGAMTGKIVFPAGNQNIGISNDDDVKILGYGSGYFRFGDPSYPMQMRGSSANPLYGEKSVLLEGDVYSKDKIDAALGSYITDVAALVGGDA